MKSWAIFDLDGTICNNTHRLHILEMLPRDWDRFHSYLHKDTPNEAVVMTMRALQALGIKIALCTGRTETYRDQTIAWLRRHDLAWDRLLMRPEGNKQSDDIVKPALADDCGFSPDNVLFVMEDRDKMVRKWRQIGYVCFQVQEGAY